MLNTSLSLSQDEHRNYGPDCMEIMERQPKYPRDRWPKHPNCKSLESFGCLIYPLLGFSQRVIVIIVESVAITTCVLILGSLHPIVEDGQT